MPMVGGLVGLRCDLPVSQLPGSEAPDQTANRRYRYSEGGSPGLAVACPSRPRQPPDAQGGSYRRVGGWKSPVGVHCLE